MWDRKLFKANGKLHFQNNYWPCIAVSILLVILAGGSGGLSYKFAPSRFAQNGFMQLSPDAAALLGVIFLFLIGAAFVMTLISIAVGLLVSNPYDVGSRRFYMENSFHPGTRFSAVKIGFTGNFGNVVLTQFLKNLYIVLWSLLFLVPGIVRSYAYFAVPYILSENPSMPHKQALELSRAMTKGYKGNIFVTHLSFILWHLLSCLTLGILSIFFVTPYIHATEAEIYRFLREHALANGLASTEDLPGFGQEPEYDPCPADSSAAAPLEMPGHTEAADASTSDGAASTPAPEQEPAPEQADADSQPDAAPHSDADASPAEPRDAGDPEEPRS